MCTRGPSQCPRARQQHTASSSTKRSGDDELNPIPTLKPEHVSLGKCAACHQFIHRYSSVNQPDVVDLLRVGCHYNGFKNIAAESPEEEGFVNMHHVLILSTLDNTETKEVCVQRTNDYSIEDSQLKEHNIVISDDDSVVILVSKPSHDSVDAFYFGKCDHARMELKVPLDVDFDVMLTRNVLLVTFDDYILIAAFHGHDSFTKIVEFQPNIEIVAASNLMLVIDHLSPETETSSSHNQLPSTDKEAPFSFEETLCIEHLDKPTSRDISVTKETKARLKESIRVAIFSVYRNIIWLSITDNDIEVYSYSRSKDLTLLDTIPVKSCIRCNEKDTFSFVNFSMSSCSMQGFLLYIRNTTKVNNNSNNGDKTSMILVMDLKKLRIVSVLEMELSMNRDPELKMFPSRDGSKLFVQERFENRVIFYQVFSLLPTDFSLGRISKQFVWNNFAKDDVLKSSLPASLMDEVLLGY